MGFCMIQPSMTCLPYPIRENRLARDSAYQVWDKSGERGAGRLGVKVEPSGQRVFYYRYYWDAKRHFIQFGRYPEMSLAQARQLAKGYAGTLKEGKNPKVEKAEQEVALEKQKRAEQLKGSIEQLIQGYTNKMREDGKRTWQQVLYRLEKETYSLLLPKMPKQTKSRRYISNRFCLPLFSAARALKRTVI